MYLVPLLIPLFNYATILSGLLIVIIKEDTFPVLDEIGQPAAQSLAIYSCGMTFTGSLIGITIFLQYYSYANQLIDQTRDPLSETFETVVDPRIKFLMRLNLVTVFVGMIHSIFIGLAASMNPRFMEWHWTTLGVKLVSGVLYMNLSLWMNFKMSSNSTRPTSALEKPPSFFTANILKIRLAVVVSTVLTVVLFLIFDLVNIHIAAAVFSYIVNLLFVIYFALFAVEFKDFSLVISNKTTQYSAVINLQSI
eukprot:TRINITY_DN2538_c0_g1_i1.p1 TRINITY_DN2538_c0_g1~~TRINITY_DN2538_c0_g1_i1.p1  ORF type:complete len:251 (-),score=33.58 TRINITY_DN2538_c0_g1_i1:126-878(-)